MLHVSCCTFVLLLFTTPLAEKNGENVHSALLTPDSPQSEIVATNFYDRAKFWAKNWAKFWTRFSGHFRASLAAQNDPPIFSPNSSQFITPCLVAEILKFLLRELLGFGGRNERVPGHPRAWTSAFSGLCLPFRPLPRESKSTPWKP